MSRKITSLAIQIAGHNSFKTDQIKSDLVNFLTGNPGNLQGARIWISFDEQFGSGEWLEWLEDRAAETANLIHQPFRISRP